MSLLKYTIIYIELFAILYLTAFYDPIAAALVAFVPILFVSLISRDRVITWGWIVTLGLLTLLVFFSQFDLIFDYYV